MPLGIVTIAAGERVAVSHPFAGTSWPNAALTPGGVAAFIFGHALFRHELAIGRVGVRVASRRRVARGDAARRVGRGCRGSCARPGARRGYRARSFRNMTERLTDGPEAR